MTASIARGWGRGVAAVAAAALAACTAASDSNPNLQSLDRPTDVAFACYGPLRITNGGAVTADQPIVQTGQPNSSCNTRALPVTGDPSTSVEDVPPGQQDLDNQRSLRRSHYWYSFILQSVPGTVAIAESPVTKPGDPISDGYIFIHDATSLTPGKNALSVGVLPVGIAADPAGCHMVTANAGSCDLSIIDVNRAITNAAEPAVRHQAITTPTGVPVLARPAKILASRDGEVLEAPDRPVGNECPAEPDGVYYIAYPDCHAVAVVRADTGEVQGSIRFRPDGTAEIGDGELRCAAECGGGGPVTDGPRPVALDLVRDDAAGTIRLAIGLDNRPVVTVVDLDPTWQPFGYKQVELSGDVGVTDVAITPQIGVGGGIMADDHAPGTDQAQFVYAVATDGSVRVAEVFDLDSECDTQADPRFLLEEPDASVFTCIPVGLPGGPPRRAKADGPGIRAPGDAVPVSVTIVRANLQTSVSLSAKNLRGTFAMVALSNGGVVVVNVDDDNYLDDQLTATDPFATQLALAMPHQIRDSFDNRVARAQTTVDGQVVPVCKTNGLVSTAGGPRIVDAPLQVLRATAIAGEKSFALPFVRQVDCDGNDGRVPVSELSINAPDQVRLETYPDWAGLEKDEIWSLTWEGSLSLDTVDTAVDGPAVRQAQIDVAGGGLTVVDAARPFCQIGVEDRDTVVLRGCDPTRGDAQCGAGMTCYVHPDSTQAAGACLPKAQLTELVGPCRDFLVSSRRFAVKRSFSDRLELIERRRVLRTTPIDGCTSAQQCQTLATYEDSLVSARSPIDDTTPDSTRTFACEVDPSRPLSNGRAINRCVQTCTASSECGAGGKCSEGRCLEAPVPPPACVVGPQRYEIDGSDAFIVVGSKTGYLHGMKADATGRCVKDPAASPLLAGRIPLVAPPCGTDSVGNITPNPCTIDVEQADEVPVYTANTCTQTTTEVAVRTTPAIRFRNPALTMNLVDGAYPGDARCLNDRGGSLVGIPTTYQGYQIRFRQIAGLAPLYVEPDQIRVGFMSKLVRGPDRGVWVIDEGDVNDVNLNQRGAIFRFGIAPLGGTVVAR